VLYVVYFAEDPEDEESRIWHFITTKKWLAMRRAWELADNGRNRDVTYLTLKEADKLDDCDYSTHIIVAQQETFCDGA
jgi:hypothetical protein